MSSSSSRLLGGGNLQEGAGAEGACYKKLRGGGKGWCGELLLVQVALEGFALWATPGP